MRRPYVTKCIAVSGTAILKQTGAAAVLMQLSIDQATGSPCYVISADGCHPFAVWPDELADVVWRKA